MDMKLAENIRAFRKERSLTQEQLAEVLGVTAGAVYKWEAKLSVPDLDLIVEMADFFDISVDALLSYEVKDNRLEAMGKRLRDYRRRKDRSGLQEAEKAMKKYPHSFEIVNESANLYSVFGFDGHDRGLLLRALELLEQARLLLPQNTDPEINEQTIYGKMAQAHLGLNEYDKAIELLKAHNAGGLFNHRVGQVLTMGERAEEAVPFLSGAMMTVIDNLCSIVFGYLNIYAARGDFDSVQAIARLVLGFFSGLRRGDKPNFLDKLSCALLPPLAWAQLRLGDADGARQTLRSARELASAFDREPSYDENDIRFITRAEGIGAYDDIGATAMDALNNTVNSLEDEEIAALWRAVKEESSWK